MDSKETDNSDDPLTEEELQSVYRWIDSIRLSRPKKNIARDFADAVLMAEVVHFFYPKFVELHNYVASNRMAQKMINWKTLNNKVLKKKLGFTLFTNDMESAARAEPGAVEHILFTVQQKMAEYEENRQNQAAKQAQSAADGSSGPSPSKSADNDRESKSVADPGISISTRNSGLPGNGSKAKRSGSSARASRGHKQAPVPQEDADQIPYMDSELLLEKDAAIRDLRETVELLQLKIEKLEQLVRLKDTKIDKLNRRLQDGERR